MKHLEHTPETYLYSHYNMCNIPIYFCNVDIQHLQHISKISETLKTYYCNMRFQHSICLLLGRMEARWHGARRRRGARCREVAQRSSVWSSAATWTSVRAGAGGRSMAATGGTSPGRGTWRERGWRDRGRGPSRSRDAQRAERAGDTGKAARATYTGSTGFFIRFRPLSPSGRGRGMTRMCTSVRGAVPVRPRTRWRRNDAASSRRTPRAQK
jgi:hypothetical protein